MRINRPRRFRFALRTLFVVITLICLWLGYHVDWIRQRRQERERLMARQAAIYEQPFGEGHLHGATIYHSKQELPWTLRILGEKPAKVIDSPSMPDDELDRIQKLFPEATVHVGVDVFYSPLR